MRPIVLKKVKIKDGKFSANLVIYIFGQQGAALNYFPFSWNLRLIHTVCLIEVKT